MTDLPSGPPDPRWLEAAESTPRQDELRRVGTALRRLIAGLVATDAPIEALADLADEVEGVADAWASHPRRETWSMGEAAPGSHFSSFLDDSPLLGLANPVAPPMRLRVEEVDGRDTVIGEVVFSRPYQGPPGHVHGGFIAAAWDEVLGMAQSFGGNPGMTGFLHVDYRSPTPLHQPLRFEGWVEDVQGRKITTRGRCLVGERLCSEATALFVSVDFQRIAALADQSPPPG